MVNDLDAANEHRKQIWKINENTEKTQLLKVQKPFSLQSKTQLGRKKNTFLDKIFFRSTNEILSLIMPIRFLVDYGGYTSCLRAFLTH